MNALKSDGKKVRSTKREREREREKRRKGIKRETETM
jgi:hypothetical protein